MKKFRISFILKLYFSWLIGLFLILFFAVKFIPLQKDFLGGGLGNYFSNPFFWVWANFDGEHYLSIAQNGYQPLTYFFFPLYPIFIKIVSLISARSLSNYLLSGLFVSHLSLLLGLIGFYKLLKIDFKENIIWICLTLLFIFPTSFYFGSIYTESLFFALAIWFFYYVRRGNYLVAGLISSMATATRVIGVALPICLITEMIINKENVLKVRNIFYILLSVSGIVAYMFFLKRFTGNFLEFFSTVGIFGQQRESSFILLPQVFYRYMFKILPNLNTNFFPTVFTTILEFGTAILFLVLSILSFIKLRLSYAVYLTMGYLIPTFSGSFSSLPRYVLVLFPAYILLALYLSKKRLLLFLFGVVSFILLIISLALFARGYWVS